MALLGIGRRMAVNWKDAAACGSAYGHEVDNSRCEHKDTNAPGAPDEQPRPYTASLGWAMWGGRRTPGPRGDFIIPFARLLAAPVIAQSCLVPPHERSWSSFQCMILSQNRGLPFFQSF